ncbi:MAG TPA: methionine adenosyltransferase [Acholeplasmataceae bacterium]|jgi:S-adenosylmethionine synthetase|nr:methionine adenosyltransferase [Acholeplasmataceae bacterium]
MKKLFTSESVTEGHPDKVCDQIADAILDAILIDDPDARVACEVCATTGLVMVMGEVTTTTYVDIQKIVRDTVQEIGYDRGKIGFDAENLAVLVSLDEQSPDIAIGVKDGEGAGDQGLMFGFACKETPEYMPIAISFAHKLVKRLAEVRKAGLVDYLRPDGKSQVTVEYEDGKPLRVDSIVISTQHNEHVQKEELHRFVREEVIFKTIPKELIDEKTKIYINPTGRFVLGGPKGDTGLTGRKIIVDTYGGYARHGGGAFSGKDPSKVDRSASYMARYIAKNLVAAGVAEKLEIGLSYVIGMSEPTSIMINSFGTSRFSEEEIVAGIKKVFPLTPKEISKHLNLRRPIYKQVAAYGHFGRSDLNLPWEKLDKIKEIKKHFSLS